MCFDPITGALIASALIGGGSLASYAGNQQASHAQMDAFNAERRRQAVFTQEQQNAVDDSLKQAKNIAGPTTDDAIAQRKAGFMQALSGRSPTQDFLPGSASANAVVGDSANKVVAGEQAYTANRADALARESALNDALFKTNIGVNRNGQTIDQLGSFKSGSSNALAPELQAAAQKGGLLRGIGQLASTIGGLYLGGSVLPGIATAATAGTTGSLAAGTQALSSQLAAIPVA